MGVTEILRRIWLFSENKIKSSESFSEQPTQLIIAAHNCHKVLSLTVKYGLNDQKKISLFFSGPHAWSGVSMFTMWEGFQRNAYPTSTFENP